MALWVDDSYFHPGQTGGAVSPLATGGHDDQAEEEETVEMEESPEVEEGDARALRAPVRPRASCRDGCARETRCDRGSTEGFRS